MKRRAFAILIIAVISSITNAKYSGGLGTPNDPYLISTAEDMNQIGHNPADWDKHFKMTADINLSAYTGTQFNRIGIDNEQAFGGVFDGNRHTICGFTYTAEDSDYVGIFGDVNAAGRVENVSLVDVNITGRNYVGGLAGYNDGGSIGNCYSAGKITGGDYSYDFGGLAGHNCGDISNCYSTGNVSGGNESGDIGGLVGYNDGDINNCYSTSDVSGGDGSQYIGGLVGWNEEGSISSCYFPDTEPNNGLGTPLTDGQMKQRSSFVGWDFVWETANGTDDIWAICEGVSCPKLAWQFIAGDSDNDKEVDFVDFARMGLKWSQADPNFYCGGMDLDGNGWVNFNDLAIMFSHWLE